MRALNVLLSVLVSLIVLVLVLEGGLRLLGMGPKPTIHRFDADTGWAKLPNAKLSRATKEFDVTIETNALGLRDDPMDSYAKPAGVRRVLALGDSFTLGYTVERDDLFVDLLERRWRAEGRPLEIVNAGTEGWSTDQEVAWLDAHGHAFEPDVVLLFAYENDLYWNGEMAYRRYPKPRWSVTGPREPRRLDDPGPRPWIETTAIGAFWAARSEKSPRWRPDDGSALDAEWAALWIDPPEEMKQAILRTRATLAYADFLCRKLGARLVVVPIPGKAAIVPEARAALERSIAGGSLLARLFGGGEVPPTRKLGEAWRPERPVETFLALCTELRIEAIDPRPALARAQQAGAPLYFASDWHFDPSGNRAFADLLHDELDARRLLPEGCAAVRAAATEPPKERSDFPRWPFWYAGLALVLGTLYAITYRRDTPAWRAYSIAGGMLALVFGIALGGSRLLELVPPLAGRALLALFVVGILTFVLVKLGRRLSTIAELLGAFTRRGHWYLMPLVIVLLTVGSLLVVAASSPLVAPFIYTLF